MPAYFENGVFTDATPAWHGEGIVVPDETLTAERIFELIPELASPVKRSPIFATVGNGDEMVVSETDRWMANIREIDGKILGVMGPRYQVFQNSELFSFGDAVVGAADGSHYKTAGTIKDGSVVWGLIALPGEIKIGGLDSEKMVPYLFLTNSFDGTCTLQARTCWTRVVCWNTWNMAMSAGQSFSIRHSSKMGDRVIEAQEALSMTFDLGVELESLGTKLLAEKIGRVAARGFLAELVPFVPNPTRLQKDNTLAIREDIEHIFRESPTTADAAGTKWGLLNAVTEYTQRYQQANQKAAARMQRTMLATPELNTRALALLS